MKESRRDQIAEAAVERQRAEARKFLAEAEKAEAEAATARIETESASLELQQEQRAEKEFLAGNKYHQTYVFNDSVNAQSVKACMDQFNIWDRTTEPGLPVTLVFNCPGGGVIDGMALFDFLLQFRARGHILTTVAMGYAASMAGILLQAGDIRSIGRESYLLIHEVSFGISGKIGEVEDEVKFVKMIQARVLDIFAARAKVSRAYIARQWRRKDWWLNSDMALKMGLVDTILGLVPEQPKRGKKNE